jgi:oxalate decarboxylase
LADAKLQVAALQITSDTNNNSLSGGTNDAIDIENPANLGQESTDAGAVKNLKWRFSDSKTRQLPGGWVREQVITDLPASKGIAGAQQHLTKNSIREMHWHRVAEWGYVYHGQVAVSAVDEDGRNQVEVLNEGDIWYFPKGEAHVIQGLAEQNEYLLVFDDGDFEAPGTSFNVDDWIAHTPKDVLAKSLGVSLLTWYNLPTWSEHQANLTPRPHQASTPPS